MHVVGESKFSADSVDVLDAAQETIAARWGHSRDLCPTLCLILRMFGNRQQLCRKYDHCLKWEFKGFTEMRNEDTRESILKHDRREWDGVCFVALTRT